MIPFPDDPFGSGIAAPPRRLGEADVPIAKRSIAHRRTGSIAALLLMLACAVGPAAETFAQQRGPSRAAPAKPPEKREPEPAPAAEPPPAPYDRDLMRLSEIIGALAFLRGLCAASDATEWPSRMKAIIETEGVTPNRRDRLAGAYNRGYRGYALTYRTCTPSATEATTRYLAEGDRLSRAISGRFGG